jgi:hypothetical protein
MVRAFPRHHHHPHGVPLLYVMTQFQFLAQEVKAQEKVTAQEALVDE